MDFVGGIIFLGVAVVLILLSLLAMVSMGFKQLNSSVGITRDGIPVGRAFQPWTLPDLEGHIHGTPNHVSSRWQLLIFADRSLVAFPSLVTGIHHFVQSVQEVEVLICSRDPRNVCEATMQGLGLQVPVISVNQTFYDRFHVRVMPFAFLLDPLGTIHWKGLLNTEAQLFHIWRMIHSVALEESFVKKGKR